MAGADRAESIRSRRLRERGGASERRKALLCRTYAALSGPLPRRKPTGH